MKRELNKPIVIHWSMNDCNKQGQIPKGVIESKIRQVEPIKIRFINPRSQEDWRIIESFGNESSDIKEIQVEYDFLKYDIKQCIDIDIEKKLILLAGFRGTSYCDHDTRIRLCNMIKKQDNFKIIVYISHENIAESVCFIQSVYKEVKQGEFIIKPEKNIKNELSDISILHKAISQIAELYKLYPDIKLSVYDEEKIVRDIIKLPYYMYGNMYINGDGNISMYSFMPAYNYGLSDPQVTLEEAWRKLYLEHATCDLEKIFEYPRYWFKYFNRKEIK